MPAARSYESLALSLEIDAAAAGALHSSTGGDHRAQVVDAVVAEVTIDPLTITVPSAEPGPLLNWVADALAGTQTPHSGAVVFAGATESARLQWTGGLITKVVFPAADATSKESAQFTVQISPEQVEWRKGAPGAGSAPLKGKLKSILRSHFRLDVSGASDIGKSAISVSALTVDMPLANDSVGEHRVITAVLEPPHVADLVLTLGRNGVEPGSAWFDSVVVQGNGSPTDARTVTVEFLDAALKKPLFAFELTGVLPYRRELSATPFSTAGGARVALHCVAGTVRVTTPAAVIPELAETPATVPATIGRTIDPSILVRPPRPTLPG